MSLQEVNHDVDPPALSANDKILVYHGPLLYEGKILSIPDTRDDNGEKLYVIHYSGWNKKWDEKVPQSRILIYNEENLKLQKERKLAFEAANRASKKSEHKSSGGGGKSSTSTPTSKNTTSIAGDSTTTVSIGEAPPGSGAFATTVAAVEDAKGTKPKVQTTIPAVLPPEVNSKKKKLAEAQVEPEVKNYVSKQVFEIGLPNKFKSLLSTDYDMVNRQKKISNLPGRHTVDSVLEHYVASLDPATQKSQIQFAEGIKDFFNDMLGGQLLYRFERHQYAGFIKTLKENDPDISEKAVKVAMSSFYGPIHLIRLFTKLGSSMGQFTDFDEAGLEVIKKLALHLFEYVSNHDEFFEEKADYGMSEPEYQRKE